MAKNWALVIGINGYNPLNFTPLRFAKRDAEAVKTFFEGMRFDQVCCFTDDSPSLTMPNGAVIPTLPTYGNLISFLQDRFEKPFLSPGDNCWFFFAGHGERHADKDYLMPIDANARGNKVIAGLQVDEVREWLTRSGADNVILLLDACRSEGSRGARSIDPSEQKGVITISSCNPTEKAWEIEDLGQGVFTYALLEALQLPGEQSCATVERLSSYLKHRVPELCLRYGKPSQIPRVSVDPIEKQHFILMPQFARQADIDLMKNEGFRLAFEGKLQLAEQMFLRVNVAARGLDSQALDALMRVRLQMQGMPIAPPTPLSTESSTARSPSQITRAEPIKQHLQGKQQPKTTSDQSVDKPTRRRLITLSDVAVRSPLDSPATKLAPAPPTPPADIPLESEKGINYTKLRDLLKAGNWKDADQETTDRMLQAIGKNSWWQVGSKYLLNFPCKDLKTINRLWVHYSNGHFGFSVQKQIYVECGAKLDGKYPGDEIWRKFCDRVGWRKDGNYVNYRDLQFNPLNSLKGELPGLLVRREMMGWVGVMGFSSLAQRLINCSR